MEVSGEIHAPAVLPPRKSQPGTHWKGGWVGPRADLDATEKRNLALVGNQTAAPHPIAHLSTD
jgi:hypothetical protein